MAATEAAALLRGGGIGRRVAVGKLLVGRHYQGKLFLYHLYFQVVAGGWVAGCKQLWVGGLQEEGGRHGHSFGWLSCRRGQRGIVVWHIAVHVLDRHYGLLHHTAATV